MHSEPTTNVTAIRPSVSFSEGKQMFLDLLADAYDEAVSREDGHPVACVLSLVTERGAVQTAYLTLAAVEDRNALYLSRAAHALGVDCQLWIEGE